MTKADEEMQSILKANQDLIFPEKGYCQSSKTGNNTIGKQSKQQ